MTRRVGLYGGSFDPVHDAHLAFARLARDTLALDELLWIPAGQPWQKDRPMTAAAHREAMVRLAIEGEPRFALSRIELARSGPSYTVDTVRALRAERPDTRWFLVIGADQYARFETWRDWRELLASTTLAVAARDAPNANGWPQVGIEMQRVPHEVVALPTMPISSSDVRARVAAGLPIDDLVPPSVARYIASHRLYGPPPEASFLSAFATSNPDPADPSPAYDLSP